MITYQFDPAREDLLLAVRKLAELAKPGAILVHSVVTVETENPDLAQIMDFMMADARTSNRSMPLPAWEEETPTTNEILAAAGAEPLKERIATKVSKAMGDVRSCAQCGDEFQPKRKDQILCRKAECKRAQQKSYAAKAKEVGESIDIPEIEQVKVDGVELDASPFYLNQNNGHNLSEQA